MSSSSPPVLYRLVTLEEAKEQVSILASFDDARLNRLIIRASQAIIDYLDNGSGTEGWTDTAGNPLVDADGNPQRIGAQGHLDSNGDFVLDLDTSGEPINAGISIVPGHVQEATLVLIAASDDDREGWKGDPINAAVQSLLARTRDPPVA
jgi:Phage gp6-like head-tail connector protein